MTRRRLSALACALALTAAQAALLAQYTVPNTTTTAGDEAATLGGTVLINHGLVGIGRISASATDSQGESLGSISGMQITGWTRLGDGSYTGTLNFLPDRGYNSGAFFSDYAARIQRANFTFHPYTDTANIGGTTDLEKLLAQHQITFTLPVSTQRFTYLDPTNGPSFTTGFDPGAGGFRSLFGNIVPYVFSYTGLASPSATTNTTYNNINKLPIDAEALILKPDGSGYIGDEYGGNVYYFDPAKQITGVIVPPPAQQPHLPAGMPFFAGAPNPVNGRRPNQGLEGVGLSPDGSRLFVLQQSATMQDSDSNFSQSRRQTRLLVYDVSGVPVPTQPIAVYALTLPTYRSSGNGSAVNQTAQQSEVIALDNRRLLFLPRDGNGLGNSGNNQSVYKSVRLVDLGVGNPTNFVNDAAKNAEGGVIATVNNGTATLVSGLTPIQHVEAVNVLNTTHLTKFNVRLDTGGAVTKLTLGEKWEGLSLLPAGDPAAPDDYYLFIGNDNDFLTSAGIIRGPEGLVNYNGFQGYPAARVPPALDSPNSESDTVILAYRVTITATPTATLGALTFDRATSSWAQRITIQNNTANTLAGPIHVALDNLRSDAAPLNGNGVTANQLPAGSPYITIVPNGGTLAPGATASVTVRFPSAVYPITYTPRVLVLTGNIAP